MKKVLLMVLFVISLMMQAQNKISFSEISLNDSDFSIKFKSFKLLEIHEEMQTIADGETLTLEYFKSYPFVLKENKLLANDYSVNLKNKDGIESKTSEDLVFDGRYYRNANATKDYQMALAIFENQYSFYIKDKDHEFYIEPLRKFKKEASVSDYIFYEVKDIINDDVQSCPVISENKTPIYSIDNIALPENPCKTVEINFALDFSFYTTYNSVNAAINRTLEILNLTQLNYSIANGLAYDINFKIKRHFIVTCKLCNYWPYSPDISVNQANFFPYENYSQMFGTSSDVRIYWQGDLPPNNYNGLATVFESTTCIDDPLIVVRYATLKNKILAGETNETRMVLSHEIGHMMGCVHQDSLTSIMAFCCYEGNAWHPDSVIRLNNMFLASNCFYDCVLQEPCMNTRVSDVAVNVDLSSNLINLNWLSETGMSYKIRMFSFATNTWTPYITLSYPSNTIAYPFNPEASSCRYKIEIVPLCSETEGNAYAVLFVVPLTPSPVLFFQSTIQDEPLCSGVPYTFEVGAINPGNPANYLWYRNGLGFGLAGMTTTTSALQNNDILTCRLFNSEACAAIQTTSISKTVTVVPQPCSLSVDGFEKNDFEYFPNPVKDQFTIRTLSNIKSINIYNFLGQKISEYRINSLSTVLDFSSFPDSTYLLKIEFEDYFKTIKIMKK